MCTVCCAVFVMSDDDWGQQAYLAVVCWWEAHTLTVCCVMSDSDADWRQDLAPVCW